MSTLIDTEKSYSSFRRGWGAFVAFFGFSTKTHRASKKRAKLVADVATYAVLLFGAFLMAYPFWWMLAGSFAYTPFGANADAAQTLTWWPAISTWNAVDSDGVNPGGFYNYYVFFDRALSVSYPGSGAFNFWRALFNNLMYSIVPVVVGVVTSAAAAFSFAKIEWYGRDIVFLFLLAAIMVPGASLTCAQFIIYQSMGWLEQETAWMFFIIPGMFGSIMTAFFIRQFLFGLPTSIIEAAKIDGAGYFRIFCGFILPLAMPAIMAQGILSFMGVWNNYVGSFLFITDASNDWINLPHAVYLLAENTTYKSDVGVTIAASVVVVVPVLVLFGIFQRQIIGSLMLTGSKE